MSNEAKSDEPRFTKAQVEAAARKALQTMLDMDIRKWIGRIMENLDPPNACRCGKWTWNEERWRWEREGGAAWAKPGEVNENYITCSS